MEKILIERQIITMPNVNEGRPIEQAPRFMLVLTPKDLNEGHEHRALNSDIDLLTDFVRPSAQDRHAADAIFYYRPDGKIIIFKNRYGFDGNLF